MSKMPRNFDFAEAEPRLYAWWEENGWFSPEVAGKDAEPFVTPGLPPAPPTAGRRPDAGESAGRVVRAGSAPPQRLDVDHLPARPLHPHRELLRAVPRRTEVAR